jgi:VWFA-related protein
MRRRRGYSWVSANGRLLLVAFAFSVVIFITNPIGTEEPDSGAVATFFEPLNVPLVSIDVVATDNQGRPIRGLARNDFEVFEDGRAMEITHFYAAGSEDVPPAQTGDLTRAPEATNQDIYLALYFDDTNVNLRRRAMALSRLAEFLDQPLPENLKTILVRFDGSLHVESNFSDDPAELIAAVERIRSQTPNDFSRDAYALIRDMQGASSGFANAETARGGFFDSPGGASPNSQLRRESTAQASVENMSNFAPRIKAYAQQSQQRNRASLDAFEGFVRSLRGVPGRKAVLWVGNLELRPGDGLFRIWEQMFPTDSRRQAVNPLIETMRYDMTPSLSDLINVTNSHRVTLYTLGPLVSGGGLGVSSEMRVLDTGTRPGHFGQQDVFGEQEAQHIMSDLTGGQMLVDSGDLDQQLEQVASDLGSYYSLAYVPPAPGSGEVHKITVKVNHDGANLRYRRSYQDLGAEEHAEDRTLAAAVLGVVDNPLGIKVEIREQEVREDGNYLVPVSVQIPIGGLVLMPEADRHTAQVSIFSVIRDSRGWLSDVHESAYPIQIENKELLTAVGQQADFVLGMVLRQGAHRIAVGVRDDRSSTESTAFVDLTVGPRQTEESSGSS